ncbi:Uncharacterised protein [Mycobacteroides abscessus subsp. abscessus]|nr:Uncharacterised protein [Mycobacteroides abscessus subsp. abscessus]
MCKARFSFSALCHDPAGKSDRNILFFYCFFLLFAILINQILGLMGTLKSLTEWIHSFFPQAVHFFPADSH